MTGRRLLAVMFTDIKGYSAMVGAEPAATLRAVTEHRAIIREVLAKHGGHEHRTTGDGFLVLFESAVNAVTCAIAIQERMLARNAEKPAAEQLWVRIGLNLGEVVYDDDGDIFGDAVNIAARVEPLAPPGGVAFTDAVAIAIRGQLTARIEPMGRLDLKNIATPPELFRITIAPFEAPKRGFPWGGLAVAGAGVVALAGAYVAWPEPPRWRTVSQNPVAQQHFEAALLATEAADRSLAAREMQAALDADPKAPLIHVAAATEPIWMFAGDVQPAVELVEGRSDEEAQLVRLCGWTAADGDEVAEGKAWDEWASRNPDDEVGAWLRAAHYPRHADDNVHSPREIHTNEIALRQFLERYPTWEGAKVLLGREIEHRSAAEEAIALLEEAAKGCRCPLVWQQLGHAQMGAQQYEAAAVSFGEALERDPGSWDSRYQLAEIALERGDETKRVALASALMSETNTAHERYVFAVNHANRLFTRGRRADATALIQEAGRGIGGLDLRLLGLLIDNQLWLGEPDGAEATLADYELAARDPSVPPAMASAAATKVLLYRVYIAFWRRDAAETRQLVDRLEALPADRFGAEDRAGMLYNARWRALALEKKRKEALASLSTMYGCWPKWGEARTLEITGDLDGALAAYMDMEDPDLCGTGTMTPDFEAHVHAAGLAFDHGKVEYARHKVERVRKTWTNPDPDLKVTRQLVAIEAALAPLPTKAQQ